ncbi:hypothetical protein Q0590_29600 [Rhodocytophaga aerolata]|uniref:Uncharacterized protein n=1 Tax=Rhodocytophaga aerolata TaxID=455078 RepID=A0ABT8REC4_9BACT|nr:hypothetical protein [Rhodocytophaga aerolata]MDO1450467.1 hypothetical protein [Rhodocytophaga aerolata]
MSGIVYMIDRVLIIFLLLIYSWGCKNKRDICASIDDPVTSYQDVVNIVHAISTKYNDTPIEFPINLREDSRFENLLINPCTYKPHLLKIIKDDKSSFNEKSIAFYALQHLCIDDYVDVIDVVFTQYQNKKVNDYFLHLSIYQGQFSIEVIKNYDHKKLTQKLENIKTDQQRMGKDVTYINDLLSGKIWKDLNTFYNHSGEQIPFSCN